MRFHFDADGIEEVVERIDRIADKATDLSGAWPRIGQWFGQRQQRTFELGRAKWAPLSPSYVRRKLKAGLYARGTGVRSGLMRRFASEDTPDIATPTYALFGLTRADPAMVVQRGAYLKKGRKTMRARNVVPALRGPEKRDIAGLVAEYLTEE